MDTAKAVRAPDPPLDWDIHLDALKVSLVPANAASGAPFWRLIRSVYDATARGRSTIYCEVQDEQGQRLLGQKLTLSWSGGSGQTVTENKPAPELAANFGIGGSYDPKAEPGPFTVGVDALPSDKVSGLGRPLGRDATYYLTWRRTVSGVALAKSMIRGMVVGGQVALPVLLRGGSGQPRQTTLDGSGAYSFKDLPAGTYSVEVGGVSVPNLRVDGASSLDVPLIDLRPRQSVLKGTVLTAAGDAAAGVKVVLTTPDARQEAVTDGKGQYKFSGLLAGSYSVEVSGMVQTAKLNGKDPVTLDFRFPAEAAKKLFAQYLLFGPPQQVGTRTNLLLAEDYILKFTPTVGFSVDDATQAANVIIVGDVQAVSAADEDRLKTTGSQVTRIGGGPYAIEQSFTDMVKGKGLSPVPSERLRGPSRSAKASPENKEGR